MADQPVPATPALGKCSQHVWRRGGYHGSPCSNPAKVVRNGRRYCGIHDPESPSKLKRQKEADAKFRAEMKQLENKQRRQDAINRLCGDISTDELDNYILVRKSDA